MVIERKSIDNAAVDHLAELSLSEILFVFHFRVPDEQVVAVIGSEQRFIDWQRRSRARHSERPAF